VTDGTLDEIRSALRQLKSEGKGIYAMKPLGGGHLRESVVDSLNLVRSFDEVDAVAVGMKSVPEVIVNAAIFSGKPVTEEMLAAARSVERKLMINRLCIGCGECVERCDQGALSLVEGKSEVDRDKCIICGYCVEACPVFAIRVI
jgi:ferredoxin